MRLGDKIAIKRSKFGYQIDGNRRLPIIKKTNQLIISHPVIRSAIPMEIENNLTVHLKIITKRSSLRLATPIIVIISPSHKIIKPEPPTRLQTKELGIETNAIEINPNM